jgi:natural product precursor
MKKLKYLKLNVLSETNLRNREMDRLRGGDWSCTGSCYWANNGGSSSYNNTIANYNDSNGYNKSLQGNNCYMYGCNDTYDECDFSSTPRGY